MRLWLCQQEQVIPLSLSFSIWKMGIITTFYFFLAYGPSRGCEGLMASSEAEGALRSTCPAPPWLPPTERTRGSITA